MTKQHLRPVGCFAVFHDLRDDDVVPQRILQQVPFVAGFLVGRGGRLGWLSRSFDGRDVDASAADLCE